MKIKTENFLQEWKRNKDIKANFIGINTSGKYCLSFKIYLPSSIYKFRFKPELNKKEIIAVGHLEYTPKIDIDFVEI